MYCVLLSLLLGLSNSIYASSSKDAMDSVTELGISLAKEYSQGQRALKPIISVAGGSAAGKTRFSKLLLSKLAVRDVSAQIVQLDSFFVAGVLPYTPDPSEFNNRVGQPVGQFDHRRTHRVLDAIAQGEHAIVIPVCDFGKTNDVVEHDFSGIDLVIVEGIYALTAKNTYNFSQNSALKIFLDVERSRLLSWYCARKSKKVENCEQDPITTWDFEEDYDKVIAPTLTNADILITQDEKRQYYGSVLLPSQSSWTEGYPSTLLSDFPLVVRQPFAE
jgi:uridine kinase